MAERIPQSVSYLVVFRAFLTSDGKTPATGKTIAITISKNGTAFGNPNAGAVNATEISSGFYKFTLDTTDTGTAGPLAWRGAEATINDAGDVLSVVNAHNAGFDGIANATAGAAGGVAIVGSAMTLAANQHVIVDSGTVTNLTNLPAIPANWITAAGITAAALNGKGDWLTSGAYVTPPTVSAIAAGVWQDATAADFIVAGSIGKSLFTG